MSDYVREKVVRCKVDPKIDLYDLECEYSKLFTNKPGGFSVAPTEDSEYIDYIFEYEYGSSTGEYGIARYLTEKEIEEYIPIFKEIIPDVKADDLRCVDFCWYNCCEAPTYFEVNTEDWI